MPSDAETVCEFMEPSPYSRTRSRDSEGGWWRLIGFTRKEGHWEPRDLTLDRLHEVEARLTEEQWGRYIHQVVWWPIEARGWPKERRYLHASPEQKLRALAAVLRADESEVHHAG